MFVMERTEWLPIPVNPRPDISWIGSTVAEQETINRRVIHLAAGFVPAKNLNFRQPAPDPMHKFIVKSGQLSASIPQKAFQ
jgi:hypothetical protein